MARIRVPQKSEYPYHLGARCPNREHFRIDLDVVWEVMQDYLYLVNRKYDFRTHGFVLMPNHFHLVGSTPEVEIGVIMAELMTKSSKEFNRLTGRINQNWGSRHYKCVLDNPHHLLNTYKYIYQNPLRAGLVNKVEDWKYSTLHGLLGKSKLIIPMVEDTVLFNPDFQEAELQWLNSPIHQDNVAAIRLALTRHAFKLPKILKQQHPLVTARA